MIEKGTVHRVVSALALVAVFISGMGSSGQVKAHQSAFKSTNHQLKVNIQDAALSQDMQRDAYFLTKINGAEPATDSASAATAISTGFKTDDGNIQWKTGDPIDGQLTGIAETLRTDKGFAIGVASTVQFSHATPAAFVSHNVNRNNYVEIADEIINTVQPEVVIGGGHPLYFSTPANYNYVGGQANWTNLLQSETPYVVAQRLPNVDGGITLKAAAQQVQLADGEKLIGIYGGAGGNFEYNVPSDTPGYANVSRGSIENPTLADVTDAALEVLSQDDDGFFVMFEQGDIDWANHANNFKNMIGGMWDLDQAVRSVETYIDDSPVMDWDNTLVIVTSDHSNSYLRLPYPLGKGDLPEQVGAVYPNGEVTYRTGNHTNELVTVWARGAGASEFAALAGVWYPDTNIIDNTQIYQAMMNAADAGVEHIILFIGDGMNVEHEIAGSRYLYGADYALAWHEWGGLSDAWMGYVSTWDVTTYNKYASTLSAAAYDLPTNPANLGSNTAQVGYDVPRGGKSPFTVESYPYLPGGADADDYFLTAIHGGLPATDSASAATALSTGYKTDDGNIQWQTGDPVGGSLSGIAETLRAEDGFAIGVASTVEFSHATPAGFVSHNVNRNNYSEIANEIINVVKPEVVIGAGHPIYTAVTPEYKYVGGQATWDNLVAGSTDYTFVQRESAMDGADSLLQTAATTNLANGDLLMGVFGGMGGNFEYNVPSDTPGAPVVTRGSAENPTLADVTEATLDVLSQDPDGFFVMFEQGDIDWANHASNFRNMIGGVWDLDQAVREAQDYIDTSAALDWSDTLVIVTSDHSNSYLRLPGWLGLGDLPTQTATVPPTYPDGDVVYGVNNSHTNELVTVWALGQGASLFNDYSGAWYENSRIVDNTQIYAVMLRAVKEAGVKHVILFIGDGMNIEHEIAGSRYLYGVDMGLAWHDWRLDPNGWSGYVSTWDVTTYNKFASTHSAPVYEIPTAPADLGSNVAAIGYDPDQGGYAPYMLQPNYAMLSITPGYLYQELDPGDTTSTTITLSKVGPSNPAWTLSDDAAWFSAVTSSGRLIVDGVTNVTVTFDATGLDPAFYRTNLQFDTLLGSYSIPVILKVKAHGSAPDPQSDVLGFDYLNTYMAANEAERGSEISAFDPVSKYLYITNSTTSKVDVVDLSLVKTQAPTLVTTLDVSAYGPSVTSVDVKNGILAAAVPADPKTDNGHVLFFQSNAAPVAYEVGALPDMVTFTPDGMKLLVANEGEPNDDYTIDPEGSISIIDLANGVTSATVANLGFGDFNLGGSKSPIDPKIRIFGPGASVAQDLEPEYITVSADGHDAWVTLQEANAIAFIDLRTAEITKLSALGFKDWSLSHGLDASDKDSAINITNWPIFGMYMPDGIASYTVGGQTYLITANEGDTRSYAGYDEEARIKDLNLDPTAFPNASELKNNSVIGRLVVSNAGSNTGSSYVADPDLDGDIDTLYTFGGRSFSIWNATSGALVYDSGDALEQIIATELPDMFNADNGDPADFDTRSDNKGPEPESVMVANVNGKTFAFVTMERAAGGVMIFDVSDPVAPQFISFVPEAAGDISPEGVEYVPASQSPTGRSLVILSNEVSGSTSVYEISSEPKALSLVVYLPLISQ